jgi:3-oxoacyl-[acyl-carrier-protein] synthase II
MGVVSVFGNDVGTFYDRLLAGESGAGHIDRFDPTGFTSRFAAQIRGFSSEGHIDSQSDRRLDDCQRYALVAARKALESAGLALGSRAMDKVDHARRTRTHRTLAMRVNNGFWIPSMEYT